MRIRSVEGSKSGGTFFGTGMPNLSILSNSLSSPTPRSLSDYTKRMVVARGGATRKNKSLICARRAETHHSIGRL